MKMNNILRIIVLFLLFVVIISFVFGGIITKKDSELTAEFLKNELGVEVISEGGCRGCSYIRNEDSFEEVLTIPQGVKIKKCIEFCWLGDLKLNGGTIVYDDGSELTGKAACAGACFIEKGDLKLKSGESLHIENADKVYLKEGGINGMCEKKNCVFAGSSIKAPAKFSYKDGVLEVDGGDVYASSSLQFKGLKLKDAKFILPDETKIKTKAGEIKINKDGSYLIPKEGVLTTKENIITTVEDETKMIPIGNDIRCKKDSNCVKFSEKKIDVYGGGINMKVPKNFNKELNTYPFGDKKIITTYPNGVNVEAKDEKGYPKIIPPGKSVKGYSMNGKKLAYSIDDDNVQVCSIEFSEVTGGVVGVEAAGVKCKDGKVIEAGVVGIGDSINVGMPINEDINCKVNYIIMPDKTRPVDMNRDGKVDYVLDVGKDACYNLDDYIKVKKKCKIDNKIEFKIDTCIGDNLPKGLLRGKGYKITKDSESKIEIQQPKGDFKEVKVKNDLQKIQSLQAGLGDKYYIPTVENLDQLLCVEGIKTKGEIKRNLMEPGPSVKIYCDYIWSEKAMPRLRGKSLSEREREEASKVCYKRHVKICYSKYRFEHGLEE